ncbi:MAG: M28 family peptidase [Planctomycetia bacterium]|nr:M28 family peptidase [Planctomycetia bacterium]
MKAKALNFIILGVCLAIALALVLLTSVQCVQGRQNKQPNETPLEKIPFDGALAFRYIEELCAIGPRPSGSPGMKAQQEYLEAHFKPLCDTVEYQRFQFPHPDKRGEKVLGANMIFRWMPERQERILLCAHYDTLPVPHLDPPHLKRPFVGAEDNAGGVAILMTLAKDLRRILETTQTRYGVDVVLFDAEEFMYRPHGRFCWGSEFFGRQYAAQTTQTRGYFYRCGVLLDLVTQKDLVLLKEKNSYSQRETRVVVNEIWETARRLGVKEFRHRVGREIVDDHIYLYHYGGIHVADVIDLDYEYWHTSEDTPDKCSPLSAARVGWVVSEWLKTKK